MICRRAILGLLAAMLVIGCAASSKKMNNVSLGMTKSQVIQAIGAPDSSSAKEDIELLKYRLRPGGLFPSQYYVMLRDGKVDAFGQVGDFGLGY
jgi:hypothetical protein